MFVFLITSMNGMYMYWQIDVKRSRKKKPRQTINSKSYLCFFFKKMMKEEKRTEWKEKKRKKGKERKGKTKEKKRSNLINCGQGRSSGFLSTTKEANPHLSCHSVSSLHFREQSRRKTDSSLPSPSHPSLHSFACPWTPDTRALSYPLPMFIVEIYVFSLLFSPLTLALIIHKRPSSAMTITTIKTTLHLFALSLLSTSTPSSSFSLWPTTFLRHHYPILLALSIQPSPTIFQDRLQQASFLRNPLSILVVYSACLIFATDKVLVDKKNEMMVCINSTAEREKEELSCRTCPSNPHSQRRTCIQLNLIKHIHTHTHK